jgi:hypothetical protein
MTTIKAFLRVFRLSDVSDTVFVERAGERVYKNLADLWYAFHVESPDTRFGHVPGCFNIAGTLSLYHAIRHDRKQPLLIYQSPMRLVVTLETQPDEVRQLIVTPSPAALYVMRLRSPVDPAQLAMADGTYPLHHRFIPPARGLGNRGVVNLHA